MKWFRMHHGASSHKKWLLIARKSKQPVSIVGMVAWALMEEGSKSIPRGDITGFEADEYAAYLDVDEECVDAVIKWFVDKKWIEDGILTTWEENNPKSDYSTERVRKHRKRKKAVTETDETVTETQSNKCNALDKIREDKIDKKKILKEKDLVKEFKEDVWPTYPHKQGVGEARKAYVATRRKGIPKERILEGIQNYIENKEAWREWKGFAAWLRAEMFDDEYSGNGKGPDLEMWENLISRFVKDPTKWNGHFGAEPGTPEFIREQPKAIVDIYNRMSAA